MENREDILDVAEDKKLEVVSGVCVVRLYGGFMDEDIVVLCIDDISDIERSSEESVVECNMSSICLRVSGTYILGKEEGLNSPI